MAKLQVEVRAGPGVTGYSLYVDGLPATMGAHHKGEVVCAGHCGDGSAHALLYSIIGMPGSALAITIRCSARVVFGPREVMIEAAESRRGAGREVFAL